MKDQVKTRKKLIEVSLPLEAINKACAKEKSIRFGHPSTLHLWWARRPVAAARAVIFGQMVDDPSSHPDLFPTEKAQEKERKRLFKIIEELVLWSSTTNEHILERARGELWQSWRSTCADNADHPNATTLFDRHKLPAFHDPFAGGGAIPLEAQRLGLVSHATDLNSVAVVINKAMIEIPPKVAGREPVNKAWQETEAQQKAMRNWKGIEGLADDILHYGKWMRAEAQKRIGNLYPKVLVTADVARDRPDLQQFVGQELPVIAWLWARTVKSPNPAFADVDVPLVSSFMISTKAGSESYIEPIIDGDSYRFLVRTGRPLVTPLHPGTTAGKRAAFRCLMSGVPISYVYIRQEAKAGRMGVRLMAMVIDSPSGRIYLPPTIEAERVAHTATPKWSPDLTLPKNPRDFKTPNYGLTSFEQLFTPRQLVALTTFSDLVSEAHALVMRDSLVAGLSNDGKSLDEGGNGAQAYGDIVALYLTLAVSRLSDICNALCSWETSKTQVRHLFTKQAIPMIWDFGENNVFGGAAGDYLVSLTNMVRALEKMPAFGIGFAHQQAAQCQTDSYHKIVSTDPPYYDNIGYADLSDFFYVWLRPSLQSVFPKLFATLSVPKAEELVATPYRHKGTENADAFFLNGMTEAMHTLVDRAHPAFPVTIYYAFKQSKTTKGESGVFSTGWETFLEAVIQAGFSLTGTWPMRTELSNRMIGSGKNALASSIILVCRPREKEAGVATLREFLGALKHELPDALGNLQKANILPVDLAQAAIGPGMAVYTRYSKVINAEGRPVSVGQALKMINTVLDEVLAEQEGDFDVDTRWALSWFDQNGFEDGAFGSADDLSRAKNTSVSGMVAAGILASKSGKVRLLKPEELSISLDTARDNELTQWEILHLLIAALTRGEAAAAALVVRLGTRVEPARDLIYRLDNICDRKKRTQERLAYNTLAQSWPEIMRLARLSIPVSPQSQTALFAENV